MKHAIGALALTLGSVVALAVDWPGTASVLLIAGYTVAYLGLDRARVRRKGARG